MINIAQVRSQITESAGNLEKQLVSLRASCNDDREIDGLRGSRKGLSEETCSSSSERTYASGIRVASAGRDQDTCVGLKIRSLAEFSAHGA